VTSRTNKHKSVSRDVHHCDCRLHHTPLVITTRNTQSHGASAWAVANLVRVRRPPDDLDRRSNNPSSPITLRIVTALVAGQGLGLLVVPVFYAVELVVADTADVVGAVLTAALAGLGGAALVGVARGLARARSWAKSPALVTQLILVPVTGYLLQGGRVAIGVVLLAWAGAVIGLLFAPSVGRALWEADDHAA
jgi:hypothetical protein